MRLLTPEQIDRIYEVTDALKLHRNWVVIPLMADDGDGTETVLTDGKVLIQGPPGEAFEPWLAGLRQRLESLDLSRTPRAWQHDPALLNSPPEPVGWGTLRYLPGIARPTRRGAAA